MAPLEGPVGVGALFDAIMLGCLIVQSYVYFKNYKSDTWLLKLLVLLILLLLLSHLGCTSAWLWASTEVNAGATSMPDHAAILFGISSVCTAVIQLVVRCYFSHRILKLSKSHLLAFVFFVSCIFSFTAGLGTAAVFFTNATSDLMGQLNGNWIFPLVFTNGLSCDLGINIATAIYLRSEMTDVADTSGPVAHLPFYVARTGAIMSIFDVAAMIVYWTTELNFAWVGLYVFMPGVFANTLLAALNAREKLCDDIEHQQVSKIGEAIIVTECAKRPPILIGINTQVSPV